MSIRFEDLVRSRSRTEMAEIIESAQSRLRYRLELWLMFAFVTTLLVTLVWAAVSALSRFGLAGPIGLVSFALGLAALWLWLWVVVRLSFVVGQRAALREVKLSQRAAGA
jgi:hypothetical protein